MNHDLDISTDAATVVEEHGADGTLLLRSTMAAGVLHGTPTWFSCQ